MAVSQLSQPSQQPRRHFDDDDSVASVEINPKTVDSLLAKEIDMLSFNDRNAIYEEIHGVSTMAMEETPQLIENALQRFEIELGNIDQESKFAYDVIAASASASGKGRGRGDHPHSLAYDRDFRLRFLRCEFFNVKAAARRLVFFFDMIHSLYGLEALRNFNTTMDFFMDGKEVMAALRAGYIQLLPFRDRSGRKIIVFVTDSLSIDAKTRLKIFIYMVFVASEDVETQRNGIVILFWPGSLELKLPKTKHRGLVSQSMNGVPTRFASFHFCFPNTPFFQMVQAMLSLALTRSSRSTRVKFHTGERMEIQYQLMGYGIPVNLIPTTGTGTLKTKNFAQWIKARKSLDGYLHKCTESTGGGGCDGINDPSISCRIECPGVNDVIFRSAGKSCMLNPGNVVFRGIFERYHNEHVNAGQTEKKNLVWTIVEEIESRGGKFLTWDKRGWWIPLEDRTEIRSKVAISFRDYNKQRRADLNQQSFKCSTFAFERQDGKRRKRSNSGEYSDESQSQCGGCLS